MSANQSLQVTVNSVNPILDQKRKSCMEAVNGLSPTAVKNLTELMKSPKALTYLDSSIKFMGLKAFL
jgi:hypothetical protein